MSILILAGYGCHSSVRCKWSRSRRSGSSTVGIRGSGEPGDDGGCGSVERGKSCNSVVYIWCVVAHYLARGGVDVPSELVCCGLKLLWYVFVVG